MIILIQAVLTVSLSLALIHTLESFSISFWSKIVLFPEMWMLITLPIDCQSLRVALSDSPNFDVCGCQSPMQCSNDPTSRPLPLNFFPGVSLHSSHLLPIAWFSIVGVCSLQLKPFVCLLLLPETEVVFCVMTIPWWLIGMLHKEVKTAFPCHTHTHRHTHVKKHTLKIGTSTLKGLHVKRSLHPPACDSLNSPSIALHHPSLKSTQNTNVSSS